MRHADRYEGIGLTAEDTAEYWTRAEAGDPEAAYIVGLLYKLGYGLHQDKSMAARWWEKAAERGHLRAQVQLAILLESGLTSDLEAAVHWYRRAAEGGHAEAQRYLGTLYWEGRGVGRDPNEAVTWWQRAADLGDGKAKYNLASAYWHGAHLPRDRMRSLRLLYSAAGDAETWQAMRDRPPFRRGVIRLAIAAGVLLLAGILVLLVYR